MEAVALVEVAALVEAATLAAVPVEAAVPEAVGNYLKVVLMIQRLYLCPVKNLSEKWVLEIWNHRCRRFLLFETLPFGKATLREGFANANANDLPQATQMDTDGKS